MNWNRISLAVVATGLSTLALACGGGDSSGEPADAPAEQAPAAQEAPAAEPAAAALDLSGVTLPEGVTADMVSAGAALYPSQVCTACHGPDATGVPNVGPDLTDDVWLNSDGSYEAVVTTITDGVPEPNEFASPMMPKGGMPSLTDEQVRQLAAYVYALAHGAQ